MSKNINYQKDFIAHLQSTNVNRISISNCQETGEDYVLKSNSYYNLITFKILLCEYIYNAINLFPGIKEYTIACKGTHTTFLKIGYFSELDSENEECIVKITNDIGNVVYALNKFEVFSMYKANWCLDKNEQIINFITSKLITEGGDINIETSYVSLPANKN